MHDVPLEAMNLSNAICFGNRIGEVVMAEDPKYNMRMLRSFLRVRVLLDLKKPLVEGFWIPKPDKSSAWAYIRYEKLQDFCYRCGNVAHSFRCCNKQRLMSCFDPDKPRYGSWTTTEQVRTWEDAVVVIKEEWSEINFKWRKQKEEWRNKGSIKPQKVENLFGVGTKVSISGKKSEFSAEEALPEEDAGRTGMGLKEKIVDNSSSYCAEELSPTRLFCRKEGLCGSKEWERDSEVDDPSNCMKKVEETFETPLNEKGDEKAIVVYVEKEVLEIANAIDGLNLKRGAEEELESKAKKKRRVGDNRSEGPEVISTFVRYLRRKKTKARKSILRKGHKGEGSRTDGEREKGERREIGMIEEPEGMGGWPQTAPMEP